MQTSQTPLPNAASPHRWPALLFAAILSVAGLVNSGAAFAAGAQPTHISLPSGPGSIEGLGRNFVPSLASGTAAYGIDIAVPPAAGGFAPKLSLDYDAGAGVSEVGLGFRISGLPSIRRRTEDGLPKFDEADTFELVGFGVPCDLVLMPDGFYRPQYESGSFARVQKSPDGETWEVRTKDGTTYRFGGQGFTEEEGGNAATYLLRESLDLHGHRIAYGWDTSEGYALLQSVTWNDFSKNVRQRIDLNYEARPDVHQLFSSGIKKTLSKRVKTIEVTLGGDLVRRYTLGYGAGERSLLSSVDMVGTDGKTVMPTLTLSYTEPSFAASGQTTRMAYPPHWSPANPNTALADLNGDGLPDLLVADTGSFHTVINHDGVTWKAADDWGGTRSPSLSLASTGVGLADLDGDGALDLFAKSGTDSFRYFPALDATRYADPVSIRHVPNFTFEDPDVRLADMDGDRRPDVAITTAAGLAVGYNVGGTDWSPPEPVGKIDASQTLRFSDGKTELCDVNGDRIHDICYLNSGSLVYWLGRGRGVFEPVQEAAGVPGFDASDPWKLVDLNGDGWVDLVHVGVTQVDYALAAAEGRFEAPCALKGTPNKGPQVSIQFADMNGSGTTDIVWIAAAQGGGTSWNYLELFPDGRAGLLKTIENGLGKLTRITYATAAASAAAARDAKAPWSTRMNVAMPVVAKVEVDDQLGDPALVTEYSYGNGAWDPAARTFAGFGGGIQRELGDEFTPTLVTESTFDLGLKVRVLRGATLTTEQRDASGGVFSRTTNTYKPLAVGKSSDGRAIEYAYRSDEMVEHIEGASDAQVRLTEKSWVQDEFGNVTNESDWGEVYADDLGVGNDEALTLRTFANNTDDWVLGRLATEEVTDIDGNRLRMIRRYYDGAAFKGLPLGQVTRGDVTRSDSWIEKKRFVNEDRSEYDADGNVVTVLTARGERRELTYDASHTLVESERRSNEATTLAWTTEQDARFGKLRELTMPSGARYSFRYDALGRIADIVKPGDSVDLPTVHFDYAPAAPLSRLSTSQRETSGTSKVLVTEAVTDGLGRTRGVFRAAENGRWELTEFGTFDARGQVAFSAYPSFEAKPKLPPQKGYDGTTLRRDALGRESSTEHPDGSSTRTAYTPLTRTFWDESDNDPHSEHYDTPTRYESDGRGRLAAVVEHEGKDEFSTRYTYDAVGNLLGFEDAAGTARSYTYDGRSRRIAIADPNAGNWKFVFTDANDLEQRLEPAGSIVRYVYDEFGRALEEWHQELGKKEQLAVRYHYDAASESHPELGPYLAGNLAWVEDEAGTAFLGYDARARRTQNIREWTDGTAHATRSEFDAADRQIERRFPDDSTLRYSYNARGLLEGVGPIVTDIVWNAAAGLESLKLGNGIVDQRIYDRRLRLERLTAKAPSGAVVRDLEYTLDAASRITEVADLRPGVTKDQSASATFRFNDRYRLLEMKDVRGATSFTYDAVAKIQSIQSDRDDPSLSLTNTYGEKAAGPDQLTHHGKEALAYDAAGRVVEDGTRKLAWDAKGRLMRVERSGLVEEYTYAFDDTRALKTTTGKGATNTVRYVGNDVEVRDDGLVRYVSVGNERVARLDSPESNPSEGGTGASSGHARLGTRTGADWSRFGLPNSSPPFLALAVLACGACASWWVAHARRRPAAAVIAFAVLSAFGLVIGCGSAPAPTSSPAGSSSPGVEIREAPPSTVFFLTDRQGSPLATTGADAAVLSSATYLPYGAEKHFEGVRVDPHAFVGNEHDDGAGLADFQARPYCADAGIFLAPDPLAIFNPEAAISEPSRLYPYAYAGGDPINRSDPNGRTFGEYLHGMFDEARDDLVAAARSQVALAVSDGRALAEGRVGDFLRSRAEVTLTALRAPITLAKDVANFGHDVAEAAFSASDYEAGRKAVKPVMTAMAFTATVAGAVDGLKASGCPCFAAETLVNTASGLRPIFEVKVGDLVLARDSDSGDTEYRAVLQVFITPGKPLVELRFRDSAGGVEIIRATPGHPFWVDGRGWTHAEELMLGNRVSTAERAALEVVGAGSAPDARTVYNLEVDGFHTYFVGKSEAWVHNACSCGAGSKLPRFDGPKPKYHVNEAHVRGSPNYNPRKEPLPRDASEVYKRAVPDAPHDAGDWFGKNESGVTYRFSNSNDGTAHFSGSSASQDGIRNITEYAAQRLEGK